MLGFKTCERLNEAANVLLNFDGIEEEELLPLAELLDEVVV